MTTRLPSAVVQALGDAVVDRLDAGTGPGYVEIRSGSQPATANIAATGTLLATVTLATTALAVGVSVDVTSYTWTQPSGA